MLDYRITRWNYVRIYLDQSGMSFKRVSYSSILLPCMCLEIEKLDPGILSSLILYLLLKENL